MKYLFLIIVVLSFNVTLSFSKLPNSLKFSAGSSNNDKTGSSSSFGRKFGAVSGIDDSVGKTFGAVVSTTGIVKGDDGFGDPLD